MFKSVCICIILSIYVSSRTSADEFKAAQQGDVFALHDFFRKGGDANTKDFQYGATPLHYASGAGKRTVALLLLEHKARVNATMNDGTVVTWVPFTRDTTQLMVVAGTPTLAAPK